MICFYGYEFSDRFYDKLETVFSNEEVDCDYVRHVLRKAPIYNDFYFSVESFCSRSCESFGGKPFYEISVYNGKDRIVCCGDGSSEAIKELFITIDSFGELNLSRELRMATLAAIAMYIDVVTVDCDDRSGW